MGRSEPQNHAVGIRALPGKTRAGLRLLRIWAVARDRQLEPSLVRNSLRKFWSFWNAPCITLTFITECVSRTPRAESIHAQFLHDPRIVFRNFINVRFCHMTPTIRELASAAREVVDFADPVPSRNASSGRAVPAVLEHARG